MHWAATLQDGGTIEEDGYTKLITHIIDYYAYQEDTPTFACLYQVTNEGKHIFCNKVALDQFQDTVDNLVELEKEEIEDQKEHDRSIGHASYQN